MTGERGQTLVMVALLLVALLAITALAIDGGNAYYERRQMQTAADAGALAAARAQCLGEAGWVGAGETQCKANSSRAEIGCVVGGPGAYGSAWASASETVPTWFAGVIGLTTMSVGARAEAQCSPIAGTGTLIPLTIPDDEFGVGAPYTIWNKDYGTSGSFGWLEWPDPLDPGCVGSHGTDRLRECIVTPSCAPMVRIGDVIDSETGVSDTSLVTLWDRWQCQVAVVPLYGAYDSHNKTYTIARFGAFLVTGYCDGKSHSGHCPNEGTPDCSGGDKKVAGEFVRYLDADSIAGDVDSGVYVVYLAD
ncbi:MAG: pilus assembly protein TadG-related protein [Anaerolineae bacterium]